MIILEQAVDVFARLTIEFSDSDLERAWVWGDYDEGVRFAFFRVLEELNDVAARLSVERGSIRPITTAQSLLAQYHTAFRDLEAVLLGLDNVQAAQQPAEGEWSVRTALLHIIEAERAFFAITDYSVERERAQDEMSLELSDEGWETYWVDDKFSELKASGLFSDILFYYRLLHDRVLSSLVRITEAELAAPVVFWENQPMPVRFRLGRFTAHLRQHTVQIEKTLAALNLAPSEARRLLRLIYQALAGAENNLLGEPDLSSDLCQASAERITMWTEEILASRG